MSSKYAMGESKIVFGNTYLEPLYFAESSTWHWEANNKYRRRAPAQHGCCASNRTGAFEDRRFLGKYKCEAICSSQREKVVNHLRRERLKAITKNLITTLEIEALEWRSSFKSFHIHFKQYWEATNFGMAWQENSGFTPSLQNNTTQNNDHITSGHRS